ncbi:MAG TPA: sigma-54 dependent transcriptional regulator [Bryobacterales bacterium]|nr:sigma-54 dependent transcriptional regulator [Bryobacterales bacterium]
MIRLLLHSGDRKLQSLLAVTLGSDYDVRVEPDKSKVKEILSGEQADVLILDFDSAQTSLDRLLAFLGEIRESRIPIVVMTDDEKRSTAMQLVQHGVYDLFRKPPHLLELKLVVRRAHEHAQLKRELESAREKINSLSSCDQLIGSSAAMRSVYDLIRRVGNLNTNVLIRGESGTGKELVARAIHNLSDRAKAPFIAVSCGAIPETLIEAELFGHDKGAFTGATAAREGYFEQAGEGTLLLDEIGELSLQTQVKLLRVIQQREFCRVGGKKVLPLKARLVFATHRNLGKMVEEGTFRQDLYFRINVFKIELPPLKERKEDIPSLARHFLKQYCESCGKRALELRPSAMQRLLDYEWPGNVRELENVIQRAVILAEDTSIGAEILPSAPPPAATPALATPIADSFEDQLKDYKVRLASQAVMECNGNKTLAARKLNITRAYLHRLLRQGAENDDVTVN